MISIATLKAAGLSDSEVVRVLEADQAIMFEQMAAKREKERIRKRIQRARARDTTDNAGQKEIPPTPPKEKTLSFLLTSIGKPLTEAVKEERVSVAGHELNGYPHNYRELFWAAYPHKVGKRAALKALESAKRRVAFDALMGGLERYKSTQNPEFYCHPTTWLNQDRWLDEPASKAQSVPSSEKWREAII